MIRAAIYSGGPSLEDTWRGGYDLGIAINRAAFVVPQEYWQWASVGDWWTHPELFLDYPIPSAGYFTMRHIVGHEYPKKVNGAHMLTWDDLPPMPPTTSYSITASLHLAAYIGARDITVYGHDQFEYAGNRKLSESTEVGRAVEMLKKVNVKVNIVQGIPDGT